MATPTRPPVLAPGLRLQSGRDGVETSRGVIEVLDSMGDEWRGKLTGRSNQVMAITFAWLVTVSMIAGGVPLTGLSPVGTTAAASPAAFDEINVRWENSGSNFETIYTNWSSAGDVTETTITVYENVGSTKGAVLARSVHNGDTGIAPTGDLSSEVSHSFAKFSDPILIEVTTGGPGGSQTCAVEAQNPQQMAKNLVVTYDGTSWNDGKSQHISASCGDVQESAVPQDITASDGTTAFTEGDGPTVVDQSLRVNGSDTFLAANVSIDDGFDPGADELAVDHGFDLSGSPIQNRGYNSTTGVLKLDGEASASEYRNALRNVTFDTTASPPTTADRNITFTLTTANDSIREDPTVIRNPENGHYYAYVESSGVTWSSAKTAAAGTSYAGMTGYLATITSEQENDFLLDKFQAAGWVGASDSASEGEWRWVTGPEGDEDGDAGLYFFDQTAAHVAWTSPYPAPPDGVPGGGNAVNGEYSNWHPRHEPDNKYPFFGGQDYAYFCFGPGSCADGAWKDVSSDSPPFAARGYFVEFGGWGTPPDAQTANLSDSKVVTVSASSTDGAPPTADAGADQTVSPGETVTLDGSSSAPSGESIVRYEWDTSGNGRTDLTGETSTTSFPAASEYTITLTVTDSGGDTDTDTVTVTVRDTNDPTAVISVDGPTSVERGEVLQFTGTNSTDDNAIESFEWDFGDGSANSSDVSPTHGYDATGTYTVTLVVTDTSDNTDSATASIEVTESNRPTITSLSASNPSGSDLAVSLASNQQLDDLTVEIYDSDRLTPRSDDSDALLFTLSISDFTETPSEETYSYENTTANLAAGNYTARLVTASNSNGDSGTGQEDTATVSVDTTEPSYLDGYPTARNPTTNSFEIAVNADEGGTAYYVVVSDGSDAPSTTQLENGLNADGDPSIASGNADVIAETETVFTATGLSEDTPYDAYVVVEDDAGNANTSSTLEASTIDASGPSLSAASLIETTDADGVVANGDEITISVTATDSDGVDSVTADASDFGAGDTVTLTGEGGDTYGGTVTVGTSGSPTEGNQAVTITATDALGNTNTATTGTLEVDTTAPSITEMTGPADGEYTAGETLTFTVTYDETVEVSGTPSISLDIGGSVEHADLTGGTGTKLLTFEYTIQSGDGDGDGIEFDATTVDLGGAGLSDTAGNDAATDFTGVAPDLSGVTVTTDTTGPTIDGAALAADNGYVDVTFSEGVYTTSDGTGALTTEDLSLTFSQNDGAATDVTVDSLGDTSDSTLSGGESTVRVHVSVIDGPASGVETVEIQLADGSSIYDGAGNAASASETTGTHTLNDRQGPSITSMTAPANGTYALGETLSFDVTYDDAVTVDATGGTPSVDLDVGGSVRSASYTGGSGTTTITFEYVVQSGDADPDGVAFDAETVQPNGGTMTDGNGNAARPSFNAVAPTLAGVNVDGTRPQDPASASGGEINATNDQGFSVDVGFSSQPESGAVTVKLDDGSSNVTATASANTGGTTTTVSGIDAAGLSDGQVTITAKLVDDAGNENPAGFTASSTVTKATGILPFNESFDGDKPDDYVLRGNDAGWAIVPDSHGRTVLQLTSNARDRNGLAFYDQPFDSSQGIVAEFRYYADDGDGADGLTFFLVNGSATDAGNIAAGDYGGALGYAATGSSGVPNAYLGVGFDEWGNFDEADFSGSFGGEQEVTIRGTEASGYELVASTDVDSSIGRDVDDGWRRARVTVDPTVGTASDIGTTVEMSWDGGVTWHEVVSTTYADAPPSTFKLGFTGSTGGSTNRHDVDWVSVTKPVDLNVTVTDAPDSLNRSEAITYAFEVTNDGPNDDSAVTASDNVIRGATGLTGVTWSYVDDDGSASGLGSPPTLALSNGETATVTVSGTVGDDATAINHTVSATPSSEFNDPSPSAASDALNVSVDVDETPPAFDAVRKINASAIAVVIGDAVDVDESTIAAGDFALNGSATVANVSVTANGTGADVTIRFDPVDQSNVVVSIAGQINDTAGNTLSSGSKTVSGMDGIPPSIADGDVALTNPEASDLVTTVTSSERLAVISVEIDDSGGSTIATLSTGDFTETDNGDGTYTYDGTSSRDYGETYTATLHIAEDAAGNDGAAGQTASVTIRGPAGMAGDGSAGNPYVITNVTQLQAMEQNLDAYYVLGNDIDASETENWNGGAGFDPIGDCPGSHSHLYSNCAGGDPFTGSFDGRSNLISNLTIDRTTGTGVGLFGLAEGASFRNVRLEDVDVTGEENVGGLVGHMQRDGSGYPSGSVENVSVRGNVTWSATGGGSAGGKFGGIVGLAANAKLDNQNVFRGNVTGKFNVGGLVGRMAWDTTIGASYARGTVRSTAADDAECSVGNGKCEAGGLAGNSGNPSTISEAYAAVTVSAPTAGAIIGDDNHGKGADTLSNVYWDTDLGPAAASSGPIDSSSTGYTGLPTAEMQGATATDTMDFDWVETWQTVPGDYPVFQWEAAALDPVSVTGTITDALDDSSLAGVPVESTIDSTTTDASGNFTLEVSALGDSVAATATVDEGFTIVNETIIGNPSDSTTYDLALRPEYNGSGTGADPYRVETLEDLQQMRYDVEASYELSNDIDASPTSSWFDGDGFAPIGDSANEFTGSFHGAGSTITGLTIERSGESNVGLFGYVDSGGTIGAITIADANITGNSNVGALVGSNNGNVTRAHAAGIVTGYSSVGGLVGAHVEGTVNRSTANATVTGDYINVGGLVGYSRATILESAAGGSATSNGDDRVGGLVGTNRGTIRRSYATASASGAERVGGLVGMNWAGYEKPGEIHGSYAVGNVTASADAGGIVGFTWNGASTSDSYWDRPATGQTTTAESGTDLTTAAMSGTAAPGNMTTFDFGSTWLTTDRYPILEWQLSTLAVQLVSSTITTTNSTNATVTLTLEDGSTVTATVPASYASNDTGVATVSASGAVSGTSVGSAAITASHAGRSDTATVVVRAGDSIAPSISGFTVANPGGQNVTISFDSDENLTAISVDLARDGSGVTALGLANFTNASGTYTATYDGSADGTYGATLTAAQDAAGNDGAGGETDSVTVDTTGPPAPSNVTATAVADGNVTIGFDDVDDGATTYSIRRSTSADGPYAEIDTIADDGGPRYAVTDDSASDETTYFYVVVAVDDGGNDGSDSAEASATADGTAPTITSGNVSLSNPSDRNLTVAIVSDETLAAMTVLLDDSADATVRTFALADFTAVPLVGGSVRYVNTSTVASDDAYEAILTRAEDGAGNDGAAGQTATVAVDTTPPSTSNLTTSNPSGRTVTVSFDANEPLASAQVSISGAESAGLTLTNFTETGSGPYTYTAMYEGSSNGTYTATLNSARDAAGNDGAAGQSASVSVGRTVVSNDIEYVSGTEPAIENLSLDTWFSAGLLQIQVKNASADTSDFSTEDDYELSGPGADDTTVLRMNVTVQEYVPRSLIGSAHDVTWTRTNNGDGTWTISISGKPAAVESFFQTDGSSPMSWPGTITANESQEAAMTFAVDSLAVMPETYRERLNGSIMTTDAQAFGAPRYDDTGTADRVELYVEGPHFAKDGSVNDGFYEALLPQALLDAWGVEASDLIGEFDGETRSTTARSVDGGARVSFDVHYSAGDVAITIDATPPAADAGSNLTVDEDVAVTFNGSGSTDNVGLSNYTWDFGDGSTPVDAGSTPSHTFDDPGTYTVTLTASDAAGNSDIDTLTVTVADTTEPTADAGGNLTVDEDTVVTFDGSGSADNDAIANYTWDFGDGTILTDAGRTPSYTYDDPGTYAVTLTTTDAAGNSHVDALSVTVRDATAPTIEDGNVTLTNPSARDLTVRVNASEALSGIEVRLTNETGSLVRTLTTGDFTAAGGAGVYAYVNDSVMDVDGKYTASLTVAEDAAGNDGATGQADTATVTTAANFTVSIGNTSAPVHAGETLSVDVTVENVGDAAGTRAVNLTAFDGHQVDDTTESLAPGAATTVTLNWMTQDSDVGTDTITVYSANDSDSASVTIDAAAYVSGTLNATLNRSSAPNGTTAALIVEADFTNGTTQTVTEAAALSSNDTAVAAIDNDTGTVTTVSQGVVRLSATYQAETDSDNLTVTSAAYVDGSLNATLDETSIPNGTTTNLTVTAEFTNGTTKTVTGSADLSSNDTGVATIVDNGTITAVSQGVAEINASFEGEVDTDALAVEPAVYVNSSLNATLVKTSIPDGTSTELLVEADFTNGTTQTVTGVADLASNETAVATVVDDGTVTAKGQGVVKLTATFKGETDADTLTVTAAEYVSGTLNATLNKTSTPNGTTATAIVEVDFTNGTTQTVTGAADLASNDTSVASIDNDTGLVTTASEGVVEVTATYEGDADTDTLTVTAAEFISGTLNATLVETSIPNGTTTELIVEAEFTNRTTQDVTGAAGLNSNDTNVATVADDGTITAAGRGMAELDATFGGEFDAETLTVEPAAYVSGSLNVTLTDSSIPNGTTTTVTVEAAFTNNTTRDVTSGATIASNDTAIATVRGATATAAAEGSVDIAADYEGETASGRLTVDQAAYVSGSLDATLVDASIPDGTSTELLVEADFTNGTTRDVTGSATLLSNDTGVATVLDNGTVTAERRGKAALHSTFEGETDSNTLTVEPAAFVNGSLTATLIETSVPNGTTTRFVVEAAFTNGSTRDVAGAAVLWSNDTAVASVDDSTGVVVTREPGVAALAANYRGDVATDTLTVRDVTAPTAVAGPDRTVDEGRSLTFDASNSTDDVTVAGYAWDFGDGSTATGIVTNHSFARPGTYTVTLTATDGAGNSATDTVTVTVEDVTDPRARAGPDVTVAEDVSIRFDARNSSDNIGVTDYKWTLGDGSTAAVVAPTHTYTDPGVYSVGLIVTDTAGLTDSDTLTVTVTDQTNPTAAIDADATVDENTQVTFDATDSADNSRLASYIWDFGEGNTSSGNIVEHRFPEPGTYTITLTVTDDAGNTDTATSALRVRDTTPPNARASGNLTIAEDATIEFEATNSTDNVGIASYEWSFGDGTTAVGAAASHVYTDSGRFRVTLTVTDTAGNTATDTLNLKIREASALLADAGSNRTVDEDTAVSLSGKGTRSNEGVTLYQWALDDGTTATGRDITHTYSHPGTYHVTLSVTDTEGNTDTDNLTVTVTDETSPVADAGSDFRTEEDTRTPFNGTNSTDNTGIVSYLWALGDGTNATGAAPIHTYEDAGEYTVRLTVIDAAGNRDTDRLNITVKDVTPPTADAGSNLSVDEDVTVEFNGSGSSDNVQISNYTWTFSGRNASDGNLPSIRTAGAPGGLSITRFFSVRALALVPQRGTDTVTGMTANYTYTDSGTYDVTLAVEDTSGNAGSDDITVYVNETSVMIVDAGSDTTVTEDTQVSFSGAQSKANEGIVSYDWSFGDGTGGSGASVSHTFAQPGNYTVELTLTDTEGNVANDTIVVTVTDVTPPTADAGGDRHANEDTVIAFDATNSTDNVGVVSYEWTFGDGGTATGPTANHVFEDPGNYTIRLTTYDAAGNPHTDRATVAVSDLTAPAVRAEATSYRAGYSIAGFNRTIEVRTTVTDPSTVANVTVDASAVNATGSIALRRDGIADRWAATIVIDRTVAGEFQLPVTATDSAGNTNVTATLAATIDAVDPVGDAGPDRSIVKGSTVKFDATASLDNVAIETYEWDVDGDGQTDMTGSSPTNEFDETGEYVVTLTVVDTAGNVASDTLDVTVQETPDERENDSQPTPTTTPRPTATATPTPSRTSTPIRTTEVPSELTPTDTATPTPSATVSTTPVDPDSRPEISVEPAVLKYDTVAPGDEQTLTVTVENKATSRTDLAVDSTQITGKDPAAFAVVRGGAPFTLAPRESRDIEVAFRPREDGTREAQFQILSNASTGQIDIWLTNTRTYIVVQETGSDVTSDARTVNIDAYNIERNRSVVVNVSRPNLRRLPASIDTLAMTVDRSGNFTMNVSHSREPFTTNHERFEASGVVPLQYVTLNYSIPGSSFTNTSFLLRVNESELTEGVDPAAIEFYRYSGGTWNLQDATHTGRMGDHLLYSVDVVGFSQFVVVAPTETGPSPTPEAPAGFDGSLWVILSTVLTLFLVLFLIARRSHQEEKGETPDADDPDGVEKNSNQ